MKPATGFTDAEKRNGQSGALIKGLAAAGGTGAALALARRSRKRKKSARERAEAAARNLPDRAKELSGQLTKGFSSKISNMEGEEWRVWGLAALVFTWFLVRMAEVRQLKRMNRILISARA